MSQISRSCVIELLNVSEDSAQREHTIVWSRSVAILVQLKVDSNAQPLCFYIYTYTFDV